MYKYINVIHKNVKHINVKHIYRARINAVIDFQIKHPGEGYLFSD